MSNSTLLLLDTTTSTSSYSIYHNGKTIAIKHHYEAQEQAAVINLYLEQLLEEVKLTWKDIDGIGICSGPGSYTGMRIGYSVAKGLVYGLEIPFVPVSKFDVWANSVTVSGNFLIGIQARIGEYFIAVGNKSTEWIIAPQHATLADMETIIAAHDVTCFILDNVPEFLKDLAVNQLYEVDKSQSLAMDVLGSLVTERIKHGKIGDIAYEEPLYLKSVYTTVSKKKSLF